LAPLSYQCNKKFLKNSFILKKKTGFFHFLINWNKKK